MKRRLVMLCALALCAKALASGDNAGKATDARSTGPNIAYYDLVGTTGRDIRNELKLKGPVNKHGERSDALTRWDVSYHYTLRESERACRVESFAAELKVDILLPRWTPTEKTPSRLIEDWTAYSTALKRHEDRHYQLAVEAAHELERRLATLTGTRGCDALARSLDRGADQVLAEYDFKQAQFDLDSDHGANEGVILPR